MTLDDLKALEREIENHQQRAKRYEENAEELAQERRLPNGAMRQVKIGEVYGHSGVDTNRNNAKDEAFRRAWESHGRDLIRLAEMDLLNQAREERVSANTKQAKLAMFLAGAGEVEPQ